MHTEATDLARQWTRSSQAAADEVNDLETIPYRNPGGRPLCAANDLAISLHRDAICLHLESLNEQLERC
jgi:hypothetical protein